MKFANYILSFIIMLTLCGCGTSNTTSEPPIVINMPTDDSVNGYRITTTEDNSGQHTATEQPPDNSSFSSAVSDNAATATYFCASVSSNKFHTSRCGSAKNIKDENLLTSPERQYFIDKGYEPCGRCNP